MLYFHFDYIKFERNIKRECFLLIKIELGDNSSKSTELRKYNRDTNACIFSETFYFSTANPAKLSYFKINVFEIIQNRSLILLEKSLSMDSNYQCRNNYIEVDSLIGMKIKIHFFLNYSNEIRQFVATPEHHTRKEKIPEIDENDIEFKKLILQTNKVLKALIPMMRLYSFFVEFFTWKDPTATLLASFAITIFIANYEVLTPSLLIFYFAFPYVFITMVLRFAVPIEQTKFEMYRRDIKFIQIGTDMMCRSYDQYVEIIENSDKSKLISMLMQIKYLAICLAFMILIFELRIIIILVYWYLLIANSETGAKIVNTMKNMFIFGIERLWELISQFIIGDNFWIPTIEYILFTFKFRITSWASDSFSQNRKGFLVFENERWWPGKGWSKFMMPGDPKPWSDQSGKNLIYRENFDLSSKHWAWETNWTILRNQTTDPEGWQYSQDLKKRFFKPSSSLLHNFRRRCWMRISVEIIPKERKTYLLNS